MNCAEGTADDAVNKDGQRARTKRQKMCRAEWAEEHEEKRPVARPPPPGGAPQRNEFPAPGCEEALSRQARDFGRGPEKESAAVDDE